MKDYKKALLFIFLATIIGGGNAVVIKIGLMEVPSFTFNFLRFLVAFMFFLPLFRRYFRTIRENFFILSAVSLLVTANITLFNLGVKTTTASIGQMIYAGIPIVTAILGAIAFKKRLGTNKILGILLGFLGVFIIIALPLFESNNPFSGSLTGNLMIALGMILSATYTLFSDRLHKRFPETVLTLSMILTTLIIQTFFASAESLNGLNWIHNLSPITYFAILYVGLFSTALYYLFYQKAIKHASPLVASQLFYLQPISTLIWANLLLGEKLTTTFIIGSLLAFVGVWLTTRKD